MASIIEDFVHENNIEVKITTPYAHYLASKIEWHHGTLEDCVKRVLRDMNKQKCAQCLCNLALIVCSLDKIFIKRK